MKFPLSTVLQFSGVTKGNFDARRARGLLSFVPLNLADHSPTDGRARYTLADAVALDLFENANNRLRIDNEVIDCAIRNNISFIEKTASMDFFDIKDEYYIGIALVDPDGRYHFEGGTLSEIESFISAYSARNVVHDGRVSEVVLLNVTSAYRRVMVRLFREGIKRRNADKSMEGGQ